MRWSVVEIPADFPWRAGMLWTANGHGCPLCHGAGGFRWYEADGSENGERCSCCGRVPDASGWQPFGAEPDPNDPATIGALLGAVREAYHDPSMYIAPTTMLRPDGTAPMWFAYTGNGRGPVGSGPTEFTALLAAWNARPNKETTR